MCTLVPFAKRTTINGTSKGGIAVEIVVRAEWTFNQKAPANLIAL